MPDAPALHHTYNRIETAEAWAQTLGVSAEYDARLDLANLANELLWQLNERALPLPDAIQVDRSVFKPLGVVGLQAPASTNRGRIRINPDALFWRDPVAIALQQRGQKSWSSGNPLHPLLHEAGHVLVYKADSAGYDALRMLTNAQKTIVAGEVSFRACLDGYEFTAEVFAGLMAGRVFSKDIMRWYKARRGTNV